MAPNCACGSRLVRTEYQPGMHCPSCGHLHDEVAPQPAQVSSEFDYVPDSVEACWQGSWDGDDLAKCREYLVMLSSAIDWAFHPADDDIAGEAILVDAVLGAARYIAAQPCTCKDDYDACDRCRALGRYRDERLDR